LCYNILVFESAEWHMNRFSTDMRRGKTPQSAMHLRKGAAKSGPQAGAFVEAKPAQRFADSYLNMRP